MIERSNGFKWFAAYLALHLSRFRLRYPRLTLPLLLALMLGLTYVTAGLMHNVTSILIMTPIIIRLCDSFKVPSRWLLCGALIASNLGGFSTKWGDTPNIVEADVWKLSAGDFLREVVPANLIVMVVLWFVVLRLTRWQLSKAPVAAGGSGTVTVDGKTFSDAVIAADWKKVLKSLEVDLRLLVIGLGSLTAFIILHVVFDDFKIAIGGLTIVVAILLERKEDRFHTLQSLGFDVYMAFAAIFVLAGCVGESWIGSMLQQLIESTGGNGKESQPWAICLTGYLGTTFTEAASWATLASGKIHPTAASHSAAWALGGGICAGSSSLVTAASAGVILAEESARFKEPHAITFRKYMPFGLAFSAFMLIFYSLYFSLIRF
jgi:Na+/H+ antiporter NhaD/arsenite permease-like protein